ncbi:transcription/translation regulatory transformer protein RfaH [Shewanella holmiensis]|jgi:transcriptional antiterminator RfaH|uniref:Transcription antitermination protein RfaH n=1 Tax=Shewanella holmiensis TaxID=2952222 RepID=A0A9X3AW26_9GAMM|nr:transcription/translation regulatory transformer protein RfaH [Shewanella holmiensis]MCT7942934.1 transcription/translation regulatory transformer protein RfaH [Shewanella holmiensis]
MKSWYLLYCKPREELRAQQNLALQQVESYLPMIKESKTIKSITKIVETPLFPNYLFIHFDPTEFSVSKIHSTRGASRIIGCKEVMTPIDDRLINEIKRRVNAHIPKQEKGIQKGDKVKFIEGPFIDLQAIFEERNAEKRCYVLFNIMGQQKRILVDETSIKKLTEESGSK